MSRRRKHVRNLVDEALPELTQGDEVCVVTELRGGNQVEVERADGSSTLIRIPAKFSKVLWVRKGTYVLAHLEPDLLARDDVKVTGEMLRVLYKEQIRTMRKDGTWPVQFDDTDAMDADTVGESRGEGVDVQRGALSQLSIGDGGGDESESDDADLPPLTENRNRRPIRREETSSSEEEEEEEEEAESSDDDD